MLTGTLSSSSSSSSSSAKGRLGEGGFLGGLPDEVGSDVVVHVMCEFDAVVVMCGLGKCSLLQQRWATDVWVQGKS